MPREPGGGFLLWRLGDFPYFRLLSPEDQVCSPGPRHAEATLPRPAPHRGLGRSVVQEGRPAHRAFRGAGRVREGGSCLCPPPCAPELGLWQGGEQQSTHSSPHATPSAYHRSPVWCRQRLLTQSALCAAKRQDGGGKVTELPPALSPRP